MLVITCEILLSTVLTTVLIASHTVIIVSLQFSQINLNGRVISPKYPLISSTINMSATVNTFLIVSHTVVKMLTSPSHIPLKKSEMPCQILMMAVDTFSHKPLNHSVMAPQFFMIAMIATTAAIIAAIIAMIGRRETLSAPKPTAAPPAAVPAAAVPAALAPPATPTAVVAVAVPPSSPIRPPRAEVIVPTAVITFPITTSTGPTVAAISAIFTIACCIPGDRLFHFSFNDFIISANFSNIG